MRPKKCPFYIRACQGGNREITGSIWQDCSGRCVCVFYSASRWLALFFAFFTIFYSERSTRYRSKQSTSSLVQGSHTSFFHGRCSAELPTNKNYNWKLAFARFSSQNSLARCQNTSVKIGAIFVKPRQLKSGSNSVVPGRYFSVFIGTCQKYGSPVIYSANA